VKLRSDLKTAMKARDTARLTVLRATLAAITNASKTASPIQTDARLVALLRKQVAASRDAAEEAKGVGRDDLVAKEEGEIKVLEEYINDSSVRLMGQDELRIVVQKVLAELKEKGIPAKALLGEAMKILKAKDGPLDGQEVAGDDLIKTVKELLA
jgi:uncharacterized protein YqeY